jgi:hypothetical protein
MAHPPAVPIDTDPEIERRRIELYRAMSPQRKVELVEDANRTARELALAGIAHRFPEATEAERTRILFGLVLGEELATRVYGPHPFPGR